MTPNFFNGLSSLFTNVWRIFTSIRFPGTNFTFAQLFAFLLFFPIALAFFKSLLGFGGLSEARDFAITTSKYRTPRSSRSSRSNSSSSPDPAEVLARKYGG